ncbi:MAG: energy transducer TonB, partial [Rhodobacteraceae bacterium]|nr:energy transducer TonB [Paracoccaceae bacterium]
MQTGTYISGIAHLGLVGWMIFGGVFRSDPLPFEVHEVSVISAAEFEAMTAGGAEPVVLPLSQPGLSEAPTLDVPFDPVPDQSRPQPQL